MSSIEEAKAFLQYAQSVEYKQWLQMANRSWQELKRRTQKNLVWSVRPFESRKTYKYPAWWSIFKIRQPLLLSRAGNPIGKDTTEDGKDDLGQVAALCVERLAKNIPKTFDFFDTLCTARDDFIATNLGWVRAFYRRTEVKERIKKFISYSPNSDGTGAFLDEQGKEVLTDDIFQDEGGNYYVETAQIVDVDNEEVFLEPILYKDVFVDKVRRWGRVRRLAFREWFSPAQFKLTYGVEAYNKLKNCQTYKEACGTESDKEESISVIEYWDDYSKSVTTFPEHGDFELKAKVIEEAEAEREQGFDGDDSINDLNGIFNLEKFFPCPEPLIINAPTDQFYPVTEYEQISDIFDDIHSIFSKMIITTRAIRTRLIYDASIPGLKAAIDELAESDAIGVNNLTQALANAGGTLSAVAQYLPVAELVGSLSQYYTALTQRLEQVSKLTGTGDLLQGQTSENSGKTLGERQIEEKYSNNQLYEPQRKVSEFVRNCYQLLVEMAIKNFKDESLERYIIPQTFPESMRRLYPQAITLLKSNLKRFRIELETDSTVALNEQYDKAMRVELTNALAAGLQNATQIAETQPELATITLHALKFLIQGFRQAKLFQEEITTAIDAVIEKIKNTPPTPPQFDAAQDAAQFNREKLAADTQVKMQKIAADNQAKTAEIQLRIGEGMADKQIQQAKIQKDAASELAAGQMQYQELLATIQLKREELAIKKAELVLEASKAGASQQLKEAILEVDRQIAAADLALRKRSTEIDEALRASSEQEKLVTEQRLQAEHELNAVSMGLDMATKALSAKQSLAPSLPTEGKTPNLTINLHGGSQG